MDSGRNEVHVLRSFIFSSIITKRVDKLVMKLLVLRIQLSLTNLITFLQLIFKYHLFSIAFSHVVFESFVECSFWTNSEESSFGSYVESQELSTEQKQTLRCLVINFCRKFQNIRHPMSCFEHFLELVEGNYAPVEASAVQNSSEIADLFGSEIMESVIGRTYQQTIHCYFALLRDFVFVLLFLQQTDLRVSLRLFSFPFLHFVFSFWFFSLYYQQTGLTLKDLHTISQQFLPRFLNIINQKDISLFLSIHW